MVGPTGFEPESHSFYIYVIIKGTKHMKMTQNILLAASLLAISTAAQASINIDTSFVGNANDSTGYGGVGYG